MVDGNSQVSKNFDLRSICNEHTWTDNMIKVNTSKFSIFNEEVKDFFIFSKTKKLRNLL